MPALILEAEEGDASAIAEIYNHYIVNTTVTFEEQPVTAEDIAQRIDSTSLPWLVVCDQQQLRGYAYASPWSGRCAYKYTAEVTVYLHPEACGQGYGKALYQQLFQTLAEQGMHTVIAGIALPNAASIALHESFGLARVAHFKEVGFKFERWIDVAYWQGFLAAKDSARS